MINLLGAQSEEIPFCALLLRSNLTHVNFMIIYLIFPAESNIRLIYILAENSR